MMDDPRRYTCRTLQVHIRDDSDNYREIVHGMARAIASVRLREPFFRLWENAVQQTKTLKDQDRVIIARALARGICISGYDVTVSTPQYNDTNFKGHIVEVLLFCIEISNPEYERREMSNMSRIPECTALYSLRRLWAAPETLRLIFCFPLLPFKV